MEQVSECIRCEESYPWDDSLGEDPGACSWRCARAMHLPPVKRCRCGVIHRGGGSYNCGAERSATCVECSQGFSYICKGRRRSNCSQECIALQGTHSEAAKAARSDPRKIRENSAKHRAALQEKYGEGVVNPSQLPHVKEMRRESMLSRGESMGQARIEKCGSISPWNVLQNRETMAARHRAAMSSSEVRVRQMSARYPHIRYMEEFISLRHDDWARKFLHAHGRKPHPRDLMEHFNLISLPVIPVEHRALFSLKDSPLELKLMGILERFGLRMGDDFMRRSRFLVNPITGNRLELDFYLASRGIAFEVQDLATHDRGRNDAVDSWGKVKKGPSYHAMKIAVAQDAGITLHEVWEDELEDGERLLGRMREIILP